MTTTNLYPFAGHEPQIPSSCMVAPNATIVGRVVLGEDVGIWFNTVIRGDVEPITIGARTNIQDLSMVHVSDGDFPTTIGADVTVGHRAIVHGCTIGAGSMIGMGAVILDGVELGEHCLVGAGAVVTPGKKYPPRSVILGTPGKLVRRVTDAEVQWFMDSAAHYVELAHKYRSMFGV